MSKTKECDDSNESSPSQIPSADPLEMLPNLEEVEVEVEDSPEDVLEVKGF